MSIRDRVAEGVLSLFDKLGNGNSALGAIDPVALETERAARRKEREKRGNPPAGKNPIAQMVGPGEDARRQRVAMAAKRSAKVQSERNKAQEAERRKRAARAKEMAEEARRYARTQNQSTSSGYRTQSNQSGRRTRVASKDSDLAKHYKTLDLDFGADMATTKSAYRKLMRKYHPDLHKDPKKKRAATELTVKIGVAYAAIEAYWNEKR